MAGYSTKDKIRMAEATISRNVECIVITWCSDVTLRFRSYLEVTVCVYRGGKVVVDSGIQLLDNNVVGFRKVQMMYCVTLRRGTI